MNQAVQYPQNRVREYTNYFLMFILLATSANPFFFDSNEFLVAGFLLSAAVFLIRAKQADVNFLRVAGIFLILELLQSIYFESFAFQTFLSLFVKLSFAYCVVRCLEGYFFSIYIHFMKVICIISLVFYGSSFIPGVYDFIYQKITPFFTPPFYKSVDFFTAQKNVIIYTFAYDCYLSYRNPGPFWEPGIFSIFLILAVYINTVRNKGLRSPLNLLFIVTLLTTVSTAGYLGLFLLIFFYLMSNSKVRFKPIALVAVVSAAVYLYYNLSFLSEKLAVNAQMLDYTGSRFGSLVADWALFTKSPWIGWGRGLMRFGGVEHTVFTQEFHRNNGLASLITQYGIFLSLIYFYFYYLTLKYLCKMYDYSVTFALFGLVVILFVSFSQVIFTRQFFLSFLFIGLHLKRINSVPGYA